jgi:UrcA family protein
MTGLTIATAALIAAVSTSSVFAAPASSDTMSVKVRLSDLDLRSAAGAEAAYARIGAAARAICGDSPSPVDLSAAAPYRACIAAAVDNGVSTLAAPQVTALNDARHGATAVASR